MLKIIVKPNIQRIKYACIVIEILKNEHILPALKYINKSIKV